MLDRPENIIPYVVERDPRGERTYDIYSLLLKERIVFLGTGINDQVANAIIAQLLFLDREDPERDINLYINSPGGVITAGFAIYDTMQLIRPDVSTICVGMAASMGTVLLCGGAKGKRYALPNSTIHMHQAPQILKLPHAKSSGCKTKFEISSLNIPANHTRKSPEIQTEIFT